VDVALYWFVLRWVGINKLREEQEEEEEERGKLRQQPEQRKPGRHQLQYLPQASQH